MLKYRLITAFALGVAFLGALFYLPEFGWGLYLMIFIAMASHEWAVLVGYGPRARIVYPLLTFLGGVLLIPGPAGMDGARLAVSSSLIMASAAFWLVAAPFWLLGRWRMSGTWLPALVGWIVLLPPMLALMHLRNIGPAIVLVVMATVWLADTAAYFFGKRFGRRKLAPQISPGKTWAGLWGALSSVAVLAVLLCLSLEWNAWFVVGFLAVTVLSVVGDLFESMIKRQAGMKDSGSLLPGHGGVLDRIDGLTSTLPLVAFYTYFPMYLQQWFS